MQTTIIDAAQRNREILDFEASSGKAWPNWETDWTETIEVLANTPARSITELRIKAETLVQQVDGAHCVDLLAESIASDVLRLCQ